MRLPDAGFPLANDLPTSDASQSAPADAVVPVNACSVAVAVDGTASYSRVNLRTPRDHHNGTAPVSAPPRSAPDRRSRRELQRHVRGCGLTFAPIGTAEAQRPERLLP